MMSNTHIRTCRYPCTIANRPQLFTVKDWWRFFALNGRQRTALAAVAACALCVGIVSTWALHAQVTSAHNDWQQLQSQATALSKEQEQLTAERDRLSSRERISKIAAARLQLFAPRADQVQQL